MVTQHDGSDRRRHIGSIDHVGLTVPDLDAAVDFYRRAVYARELFRLGPFDAREMPASGDGDWTAAHIGVADARFNVAMLGFESGALLELFAYDRPDDRGTMPPRNCDLGGHHIAFEVKDLSAAVDHIVQCGGRALAGPINVEAGQDSKYKWPALQVNYVLDPWGNQLEVIFYPNGR